MTQCSTVERCQTQPAQTERTRLGRTYIPAVDIYETADELVVVADVPGAGAEDIDVNYERGLLTLRARVQDRENGRPYLLKEYGVGDFQRSFEIGEAIDAGKIEAQVQAGVLTLHLPKAEAVRPRKIAVKGA